MVAMSAGPVQLPETPFLSTGRLARIAGVCQETVLREIKRGRLGYHRIGREYRISPADALSWLASCHVPAAQLRVTGQALPAMASDAELWGKIERLIVTQTKGAYQ